MFDFSSYHETHRDDFQWSIYFLIISSSNRRAIFRSLRHLTSCVSFQNKKDVQSLELMKGSAMTQTRVNAKPYPE